MFDCAVCLKPGENSDGFQYYTSPDPTDSARLIVHSVCAAELIDSGKAHRVSNFAVRAVGTCYCGCGSLQHHQEEIER